MYKDKLLEQKLKFEFKIIISVNIPNFLNLSCFMSFPFQLKPTNIFKEVEVFKEDVPEIPASVTRRKTPSPKGTSQKEVDFLIS